MENFEFWKLEPAIKYSQINVLCSTININFRDIFLQIIHDNKNNKI